MPHQLVAICVVFFTIASARFLDKGAERVERSVAPALAYDIKRVLLSTDATGSSEDNFTKGCLEVTKAVVAESDGKKKMVASQLYLTCSGIEFPLDVDICEEYRSTLLQHLHKDARWNLESMDYPLFCQNMDRVVKDFKAKTADMASPAPAYTVVRKVVPVPAGITPKV
mmetsp:Transcript_10825/g.17835  ORF Transcript_10825/g.17835 Transcript_10825/m.17835 type:complete len:169 (+) Transcript_10825:72-578(+)